MKTFTDQLYDEMVRNIRIIKSDERNVLKRVHVIARMLDELMGRLKTFIVGYPFLDDDEEILFFKEIKPRFYSHLLYYAQVYDIEMGKPMGSLELQSAYLNKELDSISRYVERRFDLYRYYRSGATNRDHIYFKRGVATRDEQYIDCSYYERDPMFSSICDFAVAKLHSCDMLQEYIQRELENLEDTRFRLKDPCDSNIESIAWTAKKFLLIRLIYTFDTMATFDNGNVSLRRLQELFENFCDIKLGNIARALNEIRNQQDPGKDFDLMKEAFMTRIYQNEERAEESYNRRISNMRTYKGKK